MSKNMRIIAVIVCIALAVIVIGGPVYKRLIRR